jgi:hypothetical protein
MVGGVVILPPMSHLVEHQHHHDCRGKARRHGAEDLTVSAEALWCLAANGVPGAGVYGIVHRSACLCGWLPPTRLTPQAAMQIRHHAFWDCPVAAAEPGSSPWPAVF